MAFAVQLSLIEPNDDISLLWREIRDGRERIEKYRRALFAENTHLAKMVECQQEEIRQLKHFAMARCGAQLADLSSAYPVKEKKKRVSKKKKEIQLTFPGINA